MTYKLTFNFDAGSGVCLWSDNDAAREAYDYAVEHWDLPISENTKRKIDYVIAWYDTGLDWENPAGPSLWNEAEAAAFRQEASSLLENLKKELGSAFQITDKR